MIDMRAFLLGLIAVLVSSCGGGGGGYSSSPPPPPPPPASVDLAVTGKAVVKVRFDAPGTTVMEERLTALGQPGPDRSLEILDANATVTGRYSAPAGMSLIDFTQHPSGEVTAAVATAKTVRLVRLSRLAAVIDQAEIVDPQVATDVFFDQGGVHDPTSLLPVYTRDAVRVAAIGEHVAVALRTGQNATVAYRYQHAPGAGYQRTWRTLVEPGLSVFAIGITSGTFDTFGALENHWQLRMDASAAGDVAVAVVSRSQSAPVFAAHAAYFGGAGIAAQEGLLVTRLAPDGSRRGATVIDTVQPSELHGLRLIPAGNDVAVVGRVFSERRPDGGGWNAYVGHVDFSSGAVSSYRTLDVERGDILFDIAPLGQGRHLVAGAASYTQNPDGGSVSEQAFPLLAVLESDGTLRSRIFTIQAGPRHNQLRSLAPIGDRWLVGGMTNGPGTHSGDGNPAAIVADGFAREVALPP